ncbi:cbb3-type cytochrome c oxidase N-terminal domain-containing protein [Xanthomarina sp.]|uniref:cbb3-type cytochrome c oxidase N-terminal domain-containing protein n=1 Tax=Xanthomarina sp. TaxID=1931211 RepID=UPI002C2DD3E7|nr:cbb3-type cytochrome c oxidase N-terminal domain-containing protein [Xanthomarina sp.]HLV40349.1 cbb3-type cytochrome c oxidase N-terminal domain-containing protein [Xanthomarina sp.]
MRQSMPSWVRVPVIFFIIFGLVEYFVNSGKLPAFVEYPMVLLFLAFVLFVLVAIEAIVNSLGNILYQSLDEEGKAKYDATEPKTSKWVNKIKSIYKKSLGSKPMAKEHEIILDHSYDGIRELDNDLPPWWLYGFYASIIFAVIYLIRFEVLDGYNQYDELETEYAEAQVAIEAYKKTAKNLVDFNTVEVLTSPADLSNGKALYEINCVACHQSDGGGGIGPNLTDEHWILGGGIKHIFKTISEGGRTGKGMIAWKQSLKPLEIAQISSYVLQFQGTTPEKPKEAEGDIWKE